MVSAMRDVVNYNPDLRPMPQNLWKHLLSQAKDFRFPEPSR